ncbi:MMPL family transporter [Georgenia satyanarayanai]|uniref:MMPL family transporter n=1 Tax=Georgenia satyanarayanai TaxID=860221 RepID=UPI00203CA1FA|nr:MMPL family transporter [Georgenia satyanarayanai]MCM3660077.1 MMPL family transporter [Georgenia satyanarayanai]
MFDALARGVIRRPRTTLAVWGFLVVSCLALALGAVGDGLFPSLHSGEPRVPGAESQEGRDILASSSEGGEEVSLLVQGTDLEDPDVAADLAAALIAVRQEVEALDGVTGVIDPFLAPEGPQDPLVASLVSTSGDGFLLIAELDPGLDDGGDARRAVEDRLEEVPAELSAAAPDASGIVSSTERVVSAVTDRVEADLARGEAIALPLSLLVMVLVFGGFLAASMPLVGALASIAGGLGALLGFAQVIELDAVVVNVVTVLGLGLSIDYGLLIVSRYREEIADVVASTASTGLPLRRRRRRAHGRAAVEEAVRRTVRTAGRTVTFSAVTIAVAISALMLLSPDILRSLGAAGVSVVVIALATALTLVPALLVLLGGRLQRPSVLSRVPAVYRVLERLGDVAPEDGVFSRLARGVHRRPWLVIAGVVAVLGLLASPVLGLQLRNSTTDLIPASSDQRKFITVLGEDYPAATTPPVLVVADTDAATAQTWAQEVAALPDVTGVGEATPTESGEHVVLGVDIASGDAGGEVATDVVHAIRDLDPGFPTWVVGQAANQVDFMAAVADGLPLAGGLVLLAVVVLLFLMTGSVLIPVKAVLVNALGLAAALGVTTWVFQEGHLSGLLGFTPIGGLETYVVVVVVAFGFGLAMDYEVFLLARIKEYWDAGHDNDTAVEHGLQRSGRIITSAALIITLVFLGFVAGELMVIKQVGFALAVTVLVDATLVRMLLVPATMTVLGTWNWWAPAPLRRLHDRIGITH